MIFDSHAHYDDEAFDEDREELLSSFPDNGIGYVVNAASDFASNDRTLRLTREYPFIYGAYGIHPEHSREMNDDVMEWIRSVFRDKKSCAVGEIGLDYYWDEPDREIQKNCFVKQLHLAMELDKPVVIHSRDAAADTMEILKRNEFKGLRGVMHCFSYSKEIAEEVVNMGLYIGIGGVVTFKNGKKLKEVTSHIPMERILLETDCPYMSPVPYRGQRNSSLNLTLVADQIAELKGLGREETERISMQNAKVLFGIR